MSRKATELSDEELLDKYRKAEKWLNPHAQVTGSDKNEMGERYNHVEFMKVLNVYEALSDEMNKRGLAL